MNTLEFINTVIENKLANFNFCLPAEIVEYEFKTRKAKVKPLLNVKYNDGEVIEMPIIHNVPVLQPSAGGASVIFPVKIGDKVLLVFSQRSLEEFLKDGKQTTPDDPRQFDLTDAVAHIGMKPFSEQVPSNSPDDFVIDYDGSTLTLHPEGIVDIDAQQVDINATTVNVNANAANITAPTITMDATNVNVSGKLTAANLEATSQMKSATALIGGKDFASHTHGGVTVGAGTTGAVS